MHVPSWPSRLPAARPGWGLSLRKTCSGASQPLVPEAQAPPSALGPRPQPGCPPWASLSVSRTAPATSGWAPGWAPGACSGGTGLGGRRRGPPQLHWDNGALPSPRLSWLGQGKDEGVSGQVLGGERLPGRRARLDPHPTQLFLEVPGFLCPHPHPKTDLEPPSQGALSGPGRELLVPWGGSCCCVHCALTTVLCGLEQPAASVPHARPSPCQPPPPPQARAGLRLAQEVSWAPTGLAAGACHLRARPQGEAGCLRRATLAARVTAVVPAPPTPALPPGTSTSQLQQQASLPPRHYSNGCAGATGRSGPLGGREGSRRGIWLQAAAQVVTPGHPTRGPAREPNRSSETSPVPPDCPWGLGTTPA